MPTYVYRCRECDETFEVFQSFSDKPLKKHESCGGPLQKVFHASGIVFKGSGYYVTDSRPSKSGAPANAKPSDASTGSSDSGTTADKTSEKSAEKSSTSSPSAAASD